MEKVVVYSLPNCSQCEATKKRLADKNVDFDSVSLLDHKEQLVRFKSMGHRTAPIVVAGDSVWSGYQPEKIDSLVNTESNDVWDF